MSRDKAITVLSYAIAVLLLAMATAACPWLVIGFFLGYAASAYSVEIGFFLKDDPPDESEENT